jgi:hypothetical protein
MVRLVSDEESRHFLAAIGEGFCPLCVVNVDQFGVCPTCEWEWVLDNANEGWHRWHWKHHPRSECRC